VGVGLVIPSATSLVSETVPVEKRSFYLNNIWLAFPLGEIYVYIISHFTITENNCSGWRYVLALSAIPTLFSFCLILKIKESPRFLILNNRNEEGFRILDEIGEEKSMKLTDMEKHLIEAEIRDVETNKVEVRFHTLIDNEEYRTISYQLWSLWFVISLVFYGGLYIYPQILEAIHKTNKTENILADLIFSSVVILPNTLISGFLSELPQLGRKYTLMIGFSICFFISILCLIFQSFSYLSYSCIRAGIGISFSIIGVYTTEVYPTKIRTIGIAIGNAFTRLGGIIAPFIMEFFFKNFGYTSPILVFSLCSGIGIYVTSRLQIETYKKGLDFNVSQELNRNQLLL
jgi:putative MFS transporter